MVTEAHSLEETIQIRAIRSKSRKKQNESVSHIYGVHLDFRHMLLAVILKKKQAVLEILFFQIVDAAKFIGDIGQVHIVFVRLEKRA